MGRGLLALAIVVAAGLAWEPVLRPAYKGGVIMLHVYSTALAGRSFAAFITPAPRQEETTAELAGQRMRVSWWRPAWGDRHPGIMLVSGATPVGNDMAEIRMMAEAIARAGYLVMLPEFPFLKDERLDPAAIEQIDAAFAALRSHPASRAPSGAFGFSVGGGLLLAAAGRGEALRGAGHLGVLGAYFEVEPWLASIFTASQRRDGAIIPWRPSHDMRLRMASAAAFGLERPADRERIVEAVKAAGDRPLGPPPEGLAADARAFWEVLVAPDHDEALRRIGRLSPTMRAASDRLSVRPAWPNITAPVFWLHGSADHYVPVAEADRALAAAADRPGPLRLLLPKLFAHAEPFGESARQEGLGFWVSELGALLGFVKEILHRAD